MKIIEIYNLNDEELFTFPGRDHHIDEFFEKCRLRDKGNAEGYLTRKISNTGVFEASINLSREDIKELFGFDIESEVERAEKKGEALIKQINIGIEESEEKLDEMYKTKEVLDELDDEDERKIKLNYIIAEVEKQIDGLKKNREESMKWWEEASQLKEIYKGNYNQS